MQGDNLVLTRLGKFWNSLRSSFWFIPALLSVAAFFMAIAASELDNQLALHGPEWLRLLFYHGDLHGSRTLLSTVAGSMITVAGVTFSVTAVALTLASSQFGPRLILNFMRDRGNQIVLGTFIATFLYCLIALGNVRESTSFLPAVSTSIGLLLALASVAVLIFFIHHVSSAIRAEKVVDTVARDVEYAINQFLLVDEESENRATQPEQDIDIDSSDATTIHADKSGYIEAIDEAGLIAIATDIDGVIKLLRHPGHFVVPGEPLAEAVVDEELSRSSVDHIRQHIFIGRNRTDDQDVEYGIDQLEEIAVRALSPGINDPHTAILCINWLTAALCQVATGPLRPLGVRDDEQQVRLLRYPVTFESLLRNAFNQIRQFSYAIPSVAICLMESLGTIARSTKDDAHGKLVRQQADLLREGMKQKQHQQSDIDDLENRYDTVIKLIES